MRLAAALLTVLVALPAWADDDRMRPIIDGTVQSHPSADGHFLIWYTLDGGDALTELAADADPANGVPDAVDVVEDGLSRCWELFVDQGGWLPPGDDEGEAGTTPGGASVPVAAITARELPRCCSWPSWP